MRLQSLQSAQTQHQLSKVQCHDIPIRIEVSDQIIRRGSFGSMLKKVKNLQLINPSEGNKNKQFKSAIVQKSTNNHFENSRLNEDYDLIRNKVTLSQLQQKRSNQLFKMFEKQDKEQPDFIKTQKHKPQPDPLLLLGELQSNNQKPYKQMKQPPIIIASNNESIDESIVVKSFRNDNLNQASINGKTIKLTNERGKNNFRGIEMILLAVISAVFVSLGANIRNAIYHSQ